MTGAASTLPRQAAKWPYSGSYVSVVDEGNQRPPPSFGAPTLVWHLGLWPKAALDRRALDPTLSLEQRFQIYEENTKLFFHDIRGFLLDLQRRGRVEGAKLRELVIHRPKLAAPGVYRFLVCEPQALTFTLWWQEAAGFGALNARQKSPAPTDLRVRVQAQTHLDHATISFYIDVGKPWDKPRISSAAHAQPGRRQTVLSHVENVRKTCAGQIASGRVDLDRIPEGDITDDQRIQLREAARYCYEDIWREFTAAFGFEDLAAQRDIKDEVENEDEDPYDDNYVDERGGSPSEIFSNIRSLVIATDGIPTPAEHDRAGEAAELRRSAGVGPVQGGAATIGIGNFPTFDAKRGEPNTVLKAYWPFIRRIAPAADDRDFVACGMFDWRALFVTSLGATLEPPERDEADVPLAMQSASSLPPADASPRASQRPTHQLFISKGDPHRQQIGRMVERANAVGTMRLYALRNWQTIRNAGTHIRLIGEHLDSILTQWSEGRRHIDETLPLPDSDAKGTDDEAVQIAKDERINALNRLINATERSLIQLGADLDRIGQGGSGRLLYVISRANYFTGEFARLLETLKIDNVPTWTTYAQFVDRGLAPTFEAIESTGNRLRSLRDRLQSVTEMVQTGALIVETEATQNNTQTLRKIAYAWGGINFGLTTTVLALFLQVLTALPPPDQKVYSCLDWFKIVLTIALGFMFLYLAVVRPTKRWWEARKKRLLKSRKQ